MITKNTVLILGAGASKPYGLPTGAELRDDIRNDMISNRPLFKDLVARQDYSKDYLLKFANSFFESSQSIDRFLEDNKEDYYKLGRQVIAHIIGSYENPNNVYRTQEQRWYDYLWEQLDPRGDDFTKNKLSIVTFNYDRSLEHYLGMALRHTQHHHDATIGELLGHLTFIHLYGTIGGRPFIDKNAIPFGHVPDGKFVEAAESIHIIERENDHAVIEAFAEAHKAIANADRVYVLGFGFDPINCGKLQLDTHLNSGVELILTAQGLGREEHKELRSLLLLDSKQVVFSAIWTDCLKIFTDNYRLL